MKNFILKNCMVIIALFGAVVAIVGSVFFPEQIRAGCYGIKWTPFLIFAAGLFLAIFAAKESENENRGIQLPC